MQQDEKDERYGCLGEVTDRVIILPKNNLVGHFK